MRVKSLYRIIAQYLTIHLLIYDLWHGAFPHDWHQQWHDLQSFTPQYAYHTSFSWLSSCIISNSCSHIQCISLGHAEPKKYFIYQSINAFHPHCCKFNPHNFLCESLRYPSRYVQTIFTETIKSSAGKYLSKSQFSCQFELFRDHPGYDLSHWETTLHCSSVSHWHPIGSMNH